MTSDTSGNDSQFVLYATGYMGGHPACASGTFGQGCFNSPYDFTGGSNTSQPTIRHQGGTNFLLADGHAKFLKPAQVSVGVNNTNHTYQNGPNSGYQAASPDALFLDDGKTPVAATFSAQ